MSKYPMTLDAIQRRVHQIAADHGWTVPPFADADGVLAKLMLVTTEVAEAAEAVRHDDEANFREECADAVIRLLDIAESHGFSLHAEIIAKMDANSKREYRHGGKRA